MSDEGERGGRWADMSDDSADREESARVTVPDVDGSEPDGRAPSPMEQAREAEDVKVAPVAEGPAAQDDDELFAGEGDPQYAGVAPMAPSGPVRPGKPSSGNWQMPDWMADEDAADSKLGRQGDLDEGGRSKLALYGGVGLLVVALLAAGGVYLFKQRGGEAEAETKKSSTDQEAAPEVKMPAEKPLRQFAGRPSRVLGAVKDPQAGLVYPRLARPWQVPTKKNKLGTPGWSGQQVLVTERTGGQTWYGQLMTGVLNPSLQSEYKGPESVPAVAVQAAKGIEAQYYAFPHKSTPLASQALNVDGRKGWLVASYVTYKRAGVKATGEVVATAVIDNGRPAPAVAFAAVPNTHKTLWPDINRFMTQLKVAA
ncbi:hypothetical protein [Spirillospora sp. NPDC029432]|uniref:hypothetical protein n=1 Tax=Spirillospora sp. NPDC029432 TaxID=3154599 RepID=UPI003456463A